MKKYSLILEGKQQMDLQYTDLFFLNNQQYIAVCPGKLVRSVNKSKFTACYIECPLSSTESACAMLSPVTCLAVPYFSTSSHKRDDFQSKNIARNMYLDFH